MGHVNLFQECDKHYLVLDLKRQNWCNRFLVCKRNVVSAEPLFYGQSVKRTLAVLKNNYLIDTMEYVYNWKVSRFFLS